MNLNKLLRLGFIVSAIIFIYLFAVTPKTHCDACRFAYGDEVLNGFEAYELYEDACIETSKNTESTVPVYVDLEDIYTTESP